MTLELEGLGFEIGYEVLLRLLSFLPRYLLSRMNDSPFVPGEEVKAEWFLDSLFLGSEISSDLRGIVQELSARLIRRWVRFPNLLLSDSS